MDFVGNRALAAITLCAVSIVIATPRTTRASETWITHGPEGGYVEVLAIDPAHPSTLYAGAPRGGVFRSVNGGESWAFVAGLNPHIECFAIDPVDPATIYAGT